MRAGLALPAAALLAWGAGAYAAHSAYRSPFPPPEEIRVPAEGAAGEPALSTPPFERTVTAAAESAALAKAQVRAEAVARRLSTTTGRVVPLISAGAIVGVGLFLTVRSAVQV